MTCCMISQRKESRSRGHEALISSHLGFTNCDLLSSTPHRVHRKSYIENLSGWPRYKPVQASQGKSSVLPPPGGLPRARRPGPRAFYQNPLCFQPFCPHSRCPKLSKFTPKNTRFMKKKNQLQNTGLPPGPPRTFLLFHF
jgi:hypothetical protein